MDELDKQLIDLLVKDSYQSSQKLAKQLHVHSSTVRRRKAKLIQDGMIQNIVTLVNDKLGYLTVVVALDVDQVSSNLTMGKLSNYREVKWIAATSGRFNIIAIAWFRSSEEFYRFMQTEISELKEIRSYETFICLHTLRAPARLASNTLLLK